MRILNKLTDEKSLWILFIGVIVILTVIGFNKEKSIAQVKTASEITQSITKAK